MKTTRKLAHAALLAAGFLATPLYVAACPANQAKPFTSGPLDAQGMFSQWVVDANGVALKSCITSVTADGNPPPCFYDPVVVGNTLSESLGRGGEAFLFLADSVFTTVGAAPIDAVIVMGVETAFLSADGTPQAGTQTQFQRLRTRLNVAAVGKYKVETPWGINNYTVDTLLPPGNGQNRAEISDPIDVTFQPDSTVDGLVSPFLVATPPIPGYGPVEGYIGDGLTLTPVTGSPCGENFIRITAVGLDGVTPININNGSNVYVNNQFTVMGTLEPQAPSPLAITAATYKRVAGVTEVAVMAETSTRASTAADLTVGATTVPMAKDGARAFARTPVAALPATVSVTATDTANVTLPNTKSVPLKDLVTISAASAACSGSGILRNCLLTVNAASSDDGSGGVAPTLTLQHANLQLVNGQAQTNSAAVPASVTVTSSAGGVAVRPVTVSNQ